MSKCASFHHFSVLLSYLSQNSAIFLCFLAPLHCPYPGTHTLIISLIIFPHSNICQIWDGPPTPEAQTLPPPEPVPRDGGSKRGTAGRPPSSLEERVWGWRTGLTPVRWWSGSQVKNIWSSDGRVVAHALAHSKTGTRLTAWVLLPSLMNSLTHTHTHTHTHTLRRAVY